MVQELAAVAWESWLVLGQMAPYLLFGFLMAGVLSVCVPAAWVERHLGGRGVWPVLKASLLGVPLPLCSCSVLPVSASIRRHGASRSATSAFLLSTPQTGVDSIAVTYALLGPVFAVFRPIAALLTGLAGGGLVELVEPSGGDGAQAQPAACEEPCCSDQGRKGVVARVLHFALVTLPRDLGGALLVGIVIAGGLTALLEPNQWQQYIGSGAMSILLLMAAGVPVYVCATASVPIAAGLMHAGASPGAALAFLIAGPATNAATFATVWKLLGRRTAVLYLVIVALSAVAGGLLLNWLIPSAHAPQLHPDAHVHETTGGNWIDHLAAIGLVAVFAFSYLSARRRKTAEPEAAEEQAPTGAGQRLELTIGGMTCGHCAQTVGRALRGCQGVHRAEVRLQQRLAIVTGEGLDPQRLADVVAQLGYSAGAVRQCE